MNTRLPGLVIFLLSVPAVAGDVTYAEQAYASGQPNRAIAEYRKVLREDPRDDAAQAGLATSYETTGRLDKARQHAEAALKRNPGNVEALRVMGRLHAREQNWIKARDAYKQALKADADNPSALLGLGNALHYLGDEAGADAAFDEYVKYTQGQPVR